MVACKTIISLKSCAKELVFYFSYPFCKRDLGVLVRTPTQQEWVCGTAAGAPAAAARSPRAGVLELAGCHAESCQVNVCQAPGGFISFQA